MEMESSPLLDNAGGVEVSGVNYCSGVLTRGLCYRWGVGCLMKMLPVLCEGDGQYIEEATEV